MVLPVHKDGVGQAGTAPLQLARDKKADAQERACVFWRGLLFEYIMVSLVVRLGLHLRLDVYDDNLPAKFRDDEYACLRIADRHRARVDSRLFAAAENAGRLSAPVLT